MDETTHQTDVQTVDKTGMPVEQRIATASAAYSILQKFRQADMEDATRRAELQGMIDGNPPYDPKDLEERGLGYMINTSFLEMRSNLDSRVAAAHEMFVNVPSLVDIRLRVPDGQSQQPTADWGRIVSEEFTSLMQNWSGFLPAMDLVMREADSMGLGYVVWTDEMDWRFKAYQRGALLYDPMAPSDSNEWEVFYLYDSWPAGKLIDYIRNEESASNAGWNVPEVKKALVRVYRNKEQNNAAGDGYQESAFENIQKLLRHNNTVYTTEDFQTIRIVHMLVKEVSDREGSVTHMILLETETPGDSSKSADKTQQAQPEFLYRKKSKFAKMSNVLWTLPYNYGDGYMRSVRGVASLMAPHEDLSNRYLGRVFDAGFTLASVMIQPKDQIDYSQLQMVRLGPFTVIPPNTNAIQSTFAPQIQPLIGLRDLSVSIMKNNTGTFRQHPEMGGQKPAEKTAYQFSQEVAREARFEQNEVAFRYHRLEQLYREVFRRVTNPKYVNSSLPFPGKKEAQEFIARCLIRGVPEEALLVPGSFELYVERAVGQGSLGYMLDVTNQVFAARGAFDEYGRIHATRDWLVPRVGARKVDRYMPLVNRDSIPTNEMSIATLENNDFIEGKQVPVGSDQLHAVHFTVHVPIVTGLIQLVQQSGGQGMDLQGAVQTLAAVLPHLQRTLELLSLDPTRQPFVEQGAAVLRDGTALYEKLARELQRQQLAQEQAMQEQQRQVAAASQVMQDRDLEAKILEIQRKYEVKGLDAREKAALAREKAADKASLDRERLASDADLARQKQEVELELKRRESEAKQQREATRGAQ